MISFGRILLTILLTWVSIQRSHQSVIKVFGPGLQPQRIVMPARYFFVELPWLDPTLYSPEVGKKLAVEITGKTRNKNRCRVWVNKLDRKDGTFIVRYKIYETCYDFSIDIYYQNKPIDGSPIKVSGPVQPDQCICPETNYDLWLEQYGCQKSYQQIVNDLKPFQKVNMKEKVREMVKAFHNPESTSFCHYVVHDNEIYRDCYGKHVGFNMFSDNILLFLSRKVVLHDMELIINLGDWPLIKKGREDIPVFSWCGSDDTMDIVMPTYDITESTIENMGRVTLDTLSVQGSTEFPWPRREPRAVWRGRDSRQERLRLIDIARQNPELFNASLTNFFFFRDKEAEYGPKQPHISFFKFFDYKYQINVDGTVAAYRLPYLLAGGGMVLKQDSPYYEYFYKLLRPWEHYVPIARDLSDLKEKVMWAREHDDKARKISENARSFANEHLLPQHVICYHAVLFMEWSKRTSSEVTVGSNMTHVPQQSFVCDCENKDPKIDHEEL